MSSQISYTENCAVCSKLKIYELQDLRKRKRFLTDIAEHYSQRPLNAPLLFKAYCPAISKAKYTAKQTR